MSPLSLLPFSSAIQTRVEQQEHQDGVGNAGGSKPGVAPTRRKGTIRAPAWFAPYTGPRENQLDEAMLIHLGDGEEVLACDICGKEFTDGELEKAVDHGHGVIFCSDCHRKYAAFFGPDYRPPREITRKKGVPSPGLLRRILDTLIR